MKLLIPTDFSGHSEKCIDFLMQFADCDINEIILMHVVDYKIINETDIIFEGELNEEDEILNSVKEARIKLKKRGERLGNLNVKITFSVKVGIPSVEIIKAADEMNVSLIVMGHRGRNPAEELLLGSTAERVLHKSEKPVLLVK